jgi:hypothetical protein
MKWLKKFNESSIYEFDWHDLMPKKLEFIDDGKVLPYELGNIMMNFDMIQVTYGSNIWGKPSCLEFDFYFLKRDKDYVIDIDITFGNSVTYEFSLKKNKISLIRKEILDYGFSEESIDKLVNVFNKFKGFSFNKEDLNFLSY